MLLYFIRVLGGGNSGRSGQVRTGDSTFSTEPSPRVFRQMHIIHDPHTTNRRTAAVYYAETFHPSRLSLVESPSPRTNTGQNNRIDWQQQHTNQTQLFKKLHNSWTHQGPEGGLFATKKMTGIDMAYSLHYLFSTTQYSRPPV